MSFDPFKFVSIVHIVHSSKTILLFFLKTTSLTVLFCEHSKLLQS